MNKLSRINALLVCIFITLFSCQVYANVSTSIKQELLKFQQSVSKRAISTTIKADHSGSRLPSAGLFADSTTPDSPQDLSSHAPTEGSAQKGVPIQRIIGGEPTPEESWPYIVALVETGKSAYSGQFCGGSLIRENVVLTASHCVDQLSPDDLDVFIGSQTLSNVNGTGERIGIERIIMHEHYDSGTFINDIALLILARPANYPVVATISTEQMNTIDAGAAMTVAGWGNTNVDVAQSPDQLQQVTVEYIDQQVCADAFVSEFGPNAITEEMLCAGTFAGGQDSCHGDSGGPLLVNISGKNYQTGIVSWGNPVCALTGYYGVYARVAKYEQWIEININRFLADFPVADIFLQACIEGHALVNNWLRIDDVKFLSCNDAGVRSLAGIERYDNLTELDLSQNPITDFQPLTNLVSLQALDLSYTGLSDLSVIVASSHLQSLSIKGNAAITCLDPNSGPFSYAQLALSCYELITQVEIDDPRLKRCIIDNASRFRMYQVNEVFALTCPYLEITSLQGIDEFYNLSILNVYDNNISDLSPISQMETLRHLELGLNAIKDWSAIATLYNLEVLNIALAGISDISFLEDLSELKVIDLAFNRIIDIEPLEDKSKLEFLNLWNNLVIDIDALEDSTAITLLDLGLNKIDDISVVSDMPNIEVLYIDNNLISDLEPVSELYSLEYLNADFNPIADLSPLLGLDNIKALSIFGNQAITCVDPNADLYAVASLPEACFSGEDDD